MKVKTTALSLLLWMLILPAAWADEGQEEEGNQFIHQLKVGILAHDVDYLWSGSRRENGVDVNLEAVFAPSHGLLGGTIRPALGVSLNTAGGTSKLYADALWIYDFSCGAFVSFGLGAAVHNGETDVNTEGMKVLGTEVLFHIPFEIGYSFNQEFTLSLFFDHVSNGDLADENEGLDTLGLRLGWRF